MSKFINLQLFASLDEIVAANEKAFEGMDVKGSVGTLQAKLGELGYDVIFNNKQKAEFVPASRLDEVTSQREQFKSQVNEANAQLEKLKREAGDNQAIKAQLQALIDQNNNLLGDLEKARVDAEIAMAARDANNPKDILVFIDRNAIKVRSNGEIVGVKEEVERIKAEKPYLFTASADGGAGTGGRKGGMDNQGKGENGTVNMNNMIRKSAGRI